MLDLISTHSGSPTAQLLRLLDKEIDDLMDPNKRHTQEWSKARASAFTEALTVLTAASGDEVRNVAMLRYEERSG